MKHTKLFTLVLLLTLAACTISEGRGQSSTNTDVVPVTDRNRPLAMVTTLNEDQFRLTGKRIDPLTLTDLVDEAPIDFGFHNRHAFSPNGRILALITWSSGYNENGALHLIDWPSWEQQSTDITFDAYVSALQFGVNNRTLFWTQPAGPDPAHGTPPAFELYRYDLDQKQVTAVLPLPETFSPEIMQELPSSSQLAIYGASTDVTDVSKAVPRLLLIDQQTAKIATDIPLVGVTAGQYRLQNTTNKTPFRMARPGLAFDMAQNLLYVVHAAEDKITVVDLTAAEISRQVDIEVRLSPLERILSWGVQVAEAKVVPGTDKQAILSPDGSRLYVVGLYRELKPVEGEAHGWIWHETPLGLQVINTADLTAAQQLDLPVTDMALAPNGQWLLLTGVTNGFDAAGDPLIQRYGLYIVDTDSTAVTAHLLPEQEVRLHGFSADGRYAYVTTTSSEWLEDHYGNWQETMHVVDLSAGQVIAERTLATQFLEMLP